MPCRPPRRRIARLTLPDRRCSLRGHRGAPGTMQHTLLVVDDSEINRDMLRRRLERKGYRVITAENGEQALELVARESIDLVLLDVMMPGLSGLDVLRILRKTPAGKDLRSEERR